MASSFQIDGLVSGLKTSDMIAQLMSVERQPLKNLMMQKAKEEDRQSAWGVVKSSFSNLQAAVQKLTLRSTVNPKSASLDTPSTSAQIISASAGADAAVGSFRLKVQQLATSTTGRGTNNLGSAINSAALLKDAGFAT